MSELKSEQPIIDDEMSIVRPNDTFQQSNMISAESTPEVTIPHTQKPADSNLLQQNTSTLKRSALLVNNVAYSKLELMGKGGSSKVFKVLAPNGRIYALKRVSLKGIDQSTLHGYVNEIALLKRMSSCDRIIKLYDSEINRKAGFLHMVSFIFI